MKRSATAGPKPGRSTMRRRTSASKASRDSDGSGPGWISDEEAADDELCIDLLAKAATAFLFAPVFETALRRAEAPGRVASYIESLTRLLGYATTPDGWDELRRIERGLRRHAETLDRRDPIVRKALRKPGRRKLEADGLSLDQAAEVKHFRGLVAKVTHDPCLAARFAEALGRFEVRKNLWEIARETVERARRDRPTARRRRRSRP